MFCKRQGKHSPAVQPPKNKPEVWLRSETQSRTLSAGVGDSRGSYFPCDPGDNIGPREKYWCCTHLKSSKASHFLPPLDLFWHFQSLWQFSMVWSSPTCSLEQQTPYLELKKVQSAFSPSFLPIFCKYFYINSCLLEAPGITTGNNTPRWQLLLRWQIPLHIKAIGWSRKQISFFSIN